MSAMDEIFGPRKDRPDHPDFWRISEVLLGMDADFDPMHPPKGDRDALWRDKVAEIVDPGSVTYMAVQRTLRAFGVPANNPFSRGGTSGMTPQQQAQLAAFYIDAFIAGAKFQQAGGHQEKED